MSKRYDEILVSFRRTDSSGLYPEPRRISICFYGGDPEKAIEAARKLFQLKENWVLDEVKGEDA